MTGVLSWLVAWIIMIVLLYGLAGTRWGHTIIYYGAWLLVVTLLLINSNEFVRLLQGNLSVE